MVLGHLRDGAVQQASYRADVGLFHRSRRTADDGVRTPPSHAFGTDAEDPVVRQYRFLLRTAPADALEAAHVEVLPGLDPPVRAAILRAAQERLVAGLRLTPDDTGRLAHLLVCGERRTPGAVLAGCDASTLQQLSQAVILAESAFGLFGGYAAWDGTEPEPAEVQGDMAGFDETWHQVLLSRNVTYPGLAGHTTPDMWGGSGV